jgi:hypothetical protein
MQAKSSPSTRSSGARRDVENLYPQSALLFDEALHPVAKLGALQALVLGNAVGVADRDFAFDRPTMLSKFADQGIDGGDLIHKLLSVHAAHSNGKIDVKLTAAYRLPDGPPAVARRCSCERIAVSRCLCPIRVCAVTFMSLMDIILSAQR